MLGVSPGGSLENGEGLTHKCQEDHQGEASCASGVFRGGAGPAAHLEGWVVYRLRMQRGKEGLFQPGPLELVLQKQGPGCYKPRALC